MLDEYKILPSEISANQVQAAPDTLTGQPQDNKKVFDGLAVLIANKLNAVIEKIGSDVNDVNTDMKSTNYSITDADLKALFGNTSTLKTILQALEGKKAKWGTRQNVTLPFTAPSDGMFVATASSNGSAAALYLKAGGTHMGSFQATGGARGSACFPVHNGQSISVDYSSNISNAVYWFTPLE
jgi:hypothetical protein